MKVISELLPIGVGIALVAAVTWFMLDRNLGLGKWFLAALLFAHGWVHVMFMFPSPGQAAATAGGLAYPFDMGRSWLITGIGLEPGVIRVVGVALIVATLLGFLLAALATLGWLVPASYWGGLVLASATGSTLLLVLFFSPALLLGFGINLALWVLVLGSAWSPGGGPLGA